MPERVAVALRLAFLLLWLPGCAPSSPAIERAWVRAAPDGSALGVAYLIVNNPGARDWIVGVESDAHEMAALHETVLEQGMSRMRSRARVELEPGSSLRLEPGGLHIMLMQARRSLVAGDRIELTLRLASGAVLAGEAVVAREAP